MTTIKYSFLLFCITGLPLTLCAQPLKPVVGAIVKDGGSAVAKEAASQAGRNAAISGALWNAGKGSVAANALRAEVFRKELTAAVTPIQVFGHDWKAIGNMLETSKNAVALQTQIGASGSLLVQDIIDSSKTHLVNCRKDLALRFAVLSEQQRQGILLATEESKQDFIDVVNDIVGLGIYGDLKDAETLYNLYKEVADSDLGTLLLVPVTRSMIVMGKPERARTLVLNSPASPARNQIFAFWQEHEVVPATEFHLDNTLTTLEPLLKEVSPEQIAVFDFSPQATAFWIQRSSDVRNSVKDALSLPQTPWADASATQMQGAAGTEVPQAERVKIEPISAHIVQPDIRLQVTSPAQSGLRMPTATAAGATVSTPKPKGKAHLIRKGYPSGLTNEHELIVRWASDFRNGYFKPRNQIETIEGMSAEKANNVVEYLYYMDLPTGEKIIIQPILEEGRLPDFMYDNKLIPNTQRLPSMYYKNKFNDNVKRLIALADTPGSLYADYAELKDLFLSMKDYTFEQGFGFTNSEELSAALRKRWDIMVEEVTARDTPANPAVINRLWREPATLADGTKISLRDYFTQTRATAFFPNGTMPEFYLNSPKWVSWENVRRDLVANEILPPEPDLWINNVKKRLAGIDSSKYMTLEQFGALMIEPYLKVYRDLREFDVRDGAVSTEQPTAVAEEDNVPCVDEQIRQNNFDVIGGVCMSSFGDGGYLGNRDPNYDGTSLRARYEAKVFDNVKVVLFNDQTLKPEIKVIEQVSYLKDLKKPDLYMEKASRMVGDGLDESRDLLSVQSASAAILNIPSLRATIHPHSRISYAEKVPYMFGGGLAGYLALFTPDFYPIKEVKLLREVDGKKQWVTEYFIRREVVALASFVHRERLTFSSQASLREQVGPTLSGKSDIQFGPQK